MNIYGKILITAFHISYSIVMGWIFAIGLWRGSRDPIMYCFSVFAVWDLFLHWFAWFMMRHSDAMEKRCEDLEEELATIRDKEGGAE